MNKASLLTLTIIALISGLIFFFAPSRDYEYQDLKGPVSASEMRAIPPSPLSRYNNDDPNALAVLITDKNSNWLGLAHGLKSIGIPFHITEDVDSALKHDVTFVYPMISGRLVSSEDLQRLARYPQEGGVLIATNVLGGGLQSIFGFESVVESKSKSHITFAADYPLTRGLPQTPDRTIKIGSTETIETNPGSNAYLNPVIPALAIYEDGTAAITARFYESGAAFALGVDMGQLLLKGHNFSEVDIAETYVNSYQPTLDTLLILIREMYKYGEPDAVTLGTVPDGKSLSVMITHDVDYKHSLKNAVDYARMENTHGIRTTYFIQTKYIHDYNDVSFFDDEGLNYIKQVNALGMEIASHSVSHSLQFHTFEMGDGHENYPDYRPRVASPKATYGGSLMGELRVSKFILENFIEDTDVTSFRPGYLRVPRRLPEALYWSGYKYSSNVTANKSLTHLPFQLMAGRAYETEIDIFEFPITIDDETLPRMDLRLDEAKKIADQLAQYGGTFVTLSHPDILEHKFEFAEGFIEHVKPYAWFGSLSDFGAWWAARNAAHVKISQIGDKKQITLTCPQDIDGLTLHVPRRYKLRGARNNPDVTITKPGHWLVNCARGRLALNISD